MSKRRGLVPVGSRRLRPGGGPFCRGVDRPRMAQWLYYWSYGALWEERRRLYMWQEIVIRLLHSLRDGL